MFTVRISEDDCFRGYHQAQTAEGQTTNNTVFTVKESVTGETHMQYYFNSLPVIRDVYISITKRYLKCSPAY